jgi:hypothetical protein
MLSVAAPSRRRFFGLAPAAVCAGLIVVVVGTFLPWLRSGTVTRDSYASDSALRRLLHVDGFLAALLEAWPFVSLACAAAIALVLVGQFHAGAALAVVAASCAGGVAVAVLGRTAHGLIQPATTGPATTIAGTSITLLGVLAGFVRTSGRPS